MASESSPDAEPDAGPVGIDVIAIGGVPAAGKSSLMRSVLNEAESTPEDNTRRPFDFGLVKGTLFTHPEDKLIVLGDYDFGERVDLNEHLTETPHSDTGTAAAPSFGGTDRLSMSVAPDAEAFLRAIARRPDYTGYTVLFEGDRLFTGSFIATVRDIVPPGQRAFYLLTVDDDELDRRHEQRGDTQNESWLAGRHTKYENLRTSDDEDDRGVALRDEITVQRNQTPDDAAALQQYLSGVLGLLDSNALADIDIDHDDDLDDILSDSMI